MNKTPDPQTTRKPNRFPKTRQWFRVVSPFEGRQFQACLQHVIDEQHGLPPLPGCLAASFRPPRRHFADGALDHPQNAKNDPAHLPKTTLFVDGPSDYPKNGFTAWQESTPLGWWLVPGKAKHKNCYSALGVFVFRHWTNHTGRFK